MSLLDNPRLLEKLRNFYNYVRKNEGKIGQKQRGIDINLNNACNLRCEYCFTNSPKGDHVKDQLSVGIMGDIADQADELGIFEFDLQGGELLLRPDVLFEVLEAIKPERFYLYLTTNGYYLDKKMAERLAKAKVSRVSVSVDSMDEETHDKIRGRKDSWRRAIEGLKHAKNAGLDPYINITVGHYNAFSDDIEKMCQYSLEQGYTTLLNVATPGGMAQNNNEIMVDERDKLRLLELRKKYKNILRNIWNPFDKAYANILGCNTVNRLYITPIGDVLVCPYVHVKIGNVFEQSLKEISDYGFSIKYFHDNSDLCLAGEDHEFVSKCMQHEGQTIFNPINAKEFFTDEDYVNTH